jgi:peptide/nickel transport system permease protein
MNNFAYFIRRLLYLIPVLLGVCLVIYILFNVVAGDPTPILLGKNATAQQMAELRETMGLNRAWYLQYFDIVKSAFTFDFGRSWSTKQQISNMIVSGAGPTLTLTIPAFVISTIFALLTAIIVAYFRGGKVDFFVRVACIVGMSIPSLSYILFMQKYMAYEWGLFEISGYEAGFPNFLPYIILPGIIWIILSVGPDVRFFRTIFLDELYQDYVRTARAKGVSEKVVLLKHVLRNALIPLITYVIIQLPFLILGALLLENFFSIPGIGSMIMNSLNNNDFPVLKALSIIMSVALILFTLLTDFLYTIADPRVKLN